MCNVVNIYIVSNVRYSFYVKLNCLLLTLDNNTELTISSDIIINGN